MKRLIFCILMIHSVVSLGEPIKSMLGADGAEIIADNALPYDAEVEYLEFTGSQYIDTGLTWDGGDWICEAYLNFTSPINENYTISQYGSGQGVVYAFAYMHTSDIRLAYRTNMAASYLVSDSFFGVMRLWTARYSDGLQTLAVDGCPTLTAYQEWEPGKSEQSMRIIVGGMQTYGSKSYGVRIGPVSILHNGLLVIDYIPVRIGSIGYMYDRVSGEIFWNDGSGAFIVGPDMED